MKKVLLFVMGFALLMGCSKETDVTQEPQESLTKAAVQQAHLNINFESAGNYLFFRIPEWEQYQLSRVSIKFHNVYVWPYADPAPPFNTGGMGSARPWVYTTQQDIIAESSLSENAYIHTVAESYLDQNSIQITSRGNYAFTWTISGVNVQNNTGGGSSGGGTQTQQDNYITLAWSGSSWVITSQHPVASSIEVTCDSPNQGGMTWTLSAGQSRCDTMVSDPDFVIAEIYPRSDSRYRYTY